MKIRVEFVRSYTSRNGNKVFVYKVIGGAGQIESFKSAMGEHLRSDEKDNPLWFTTKFIGTAGHVVITTNGNVVPDMSQYDQAASLAAQYGGNLGMELARAAAQMLLGKPPVADTPSAPLELPPADADTDAEVIDA
jgi:hypothetical protein